MCFLIVLLVYILHPVTAIAALDGTAWRLLLNVGREKGTWMPSEWGASGARLALPLDVRFSDDPLSTKTPRFFGTGAEPMLGPLDGVKTLYYHNTRDGADDSQDEGCEGGACKL